MMPDGTYVRAGTGTALSMAWGAAAAGLWNLYITSMASSVAQSGWWDTTGNFDAFFFAGAFALGVAEGGIGVYRNARNIFYTLPDR